MLEFRHISVAVQNTALLDDISLSFPKGKITSIVGPNGCGKTTLLQVLNGSSKVTTGDIFLDDVDYLKLPLQERATKLAFLPQVRTIIPTLPVKTLVEHGRFPHLGFLRRKNAHDIQLVKEAMQFTHIEEYAEQYVDTLSGGIRQRAFLAMVLAQDCDYIVLDEPTTYLDLPGQREFLNLLSNLRNQGKTILLVLHDLNQALRISDRLVVMKDRKIAAAGTPQECLQQHILEDVFDVTCKCFQDAGESFYFFE